MKNLKRGKKRVKNQKKARTAGAVFMSMGLPAHIVKSVNRRERPGAIYSSFASLGAKNRKAS